ncbi:hypothetical protein [Flavihumibacter sp.]
MQKIIVDSKDMGKGKYGRKNVEMEGWRDGGMERWRDGEGTIL